MKHQRVDLSTLLASSQPRPLITADVDKLASSIREVGLIQPITVKPHTVTIGGLAEQGFQIVAGHHRVAACRALGWTEVDAIVIEDGGHLQAELIEIDENLCRSELSASQRTSHTKRRKQIWEALHPEIQVAQAAPPVIGYASPPPQTQGFASATAAATGQSKATTNRAIARAEALGDDLEKVTGTSLDSGVEMDALAAMPPEQRAPLIERAQAGEKVSARAPAAATTPAKAEPTTSPDHAFVQALCKAVAGLLKATDCACMEDVVDAINKLSDLDTEHQALLGKVLIDLRELGALGEIA